MKCMCKNISGRNVYVHKFSCERSSHDLCAHAHAHSLEGTLPMVHSNPFYAHLKAVLFSHAGIGSTSKYSKG